MANTSTPEQEEIAHLTLEHLKVLRTLAEQSAHDMRDVKFRLGQIEQTFLQQQQTLTHHTQRFDQLDDRLARVERRIGLVDA
jgi:septal ring factor EnvC (AmiA/AmiB activator)